MARRTLRKDYRREQIGGIFEDVGCSENRQHWRGGTFVLGKEG